MPPSWASLASERGDGLALEFRSKRDPWLDALLALVRVGLVALIAVLLATSRDATHALAALSPILALALVLWLSRTTAYRIGGDGLRARCGPLRFHVPFAEIEEVRPKLGLSPEMGWSLALSLDRLMVHRRGGLPLAISPEPRELFLAELAARCPHLARDGDRLAPRARA